MLAQSDIMVSRSRSITRKMLSQNPVNELCGITELETGAPPPQQVRPELFDGLCTSLSLLHALLWPLRRANFCRNKCSILPWAKFTQYFQENFAFRRTFRNIPMHLTQQVTNE